MLDGSKQFSFSGGRETQPDATTSGWVSITIWKSHRNFACSFSIAFGGVSHLDFWVSQTQPLYRCFCTVCQLPGYGIQCLPFLPAFTSCCVGLFLGDLFAQPAPWVLPGSVDLGHYCSAVQDLFL